MISPAGRLAVAQRWFEHEPGWGDRPDGWSLHADLTQHRAYLRAHAASSHGEEHDHPAGDPFDVVVDDRLHTRVRRTRLGLRTFDRPSTPEPRQVVAEMPQAEDAGAYLERLQRMYGDGPSSAG